MSGGVGAVAGTLTWADEEGQGAEEQERECAPAVRCLWLYVSAAVVPLCVCVFCSTVSVVVELIRSGSSYAERGVSVRNCRYTGKGALKKAMCLPTRCISHRWNMSMVSASMQ